MSESHDSAVLAEAAGVVVPALGEIEMRIGYLLHRTDLLHMEILQNLITPIGMTAARATAIVWINDNPGTGQSDLARALGINRASAMEMASSLEKAGLIERQLGRGRRSTALRLTPAGHEKYKQFIAATLKLDTLLGADLSPAEYLMLAEILRKVRTALIRHQEARKPKKDQEGI